MENILFKLIRRYKPRSFGWFNSYATWQEAQNQCSGYNSDAILKKIRTSTLKVKSGEAVFERDGVIYDSIYYSWPLLSQLLLAASQNNGQLSVIDFGGSLGTTFFQNRVYLQELKKVEWSVIEQGNFVTTGQSEIAGNGLDFFYTAEEAIQNKGEHQVLLLSCVLPYIEKPYELLNYLLKFSFPYIILESTYYNYQPHDRICIQKVDPVAYDASYPCWLLDYQKVKSTFLNDYDVITEYETGIHFYLDGERVEYKSLVFKRKNN